MPNSKRPPGNPGNAYSAPSRDFGGMNLPIGDSSSSAPSRSMNLPTAVRSRGIVAIQENGAPGWHSRGYLPHFESSEAIQHVTFHLADSLPQTVLERFANELSQFPPARRDVERRKRVEDWIDAAHGSCVFRKPELAAMAQFTLLAFDAQRYRIIAWVVMPNHVHALFQPMNGWTVAKIVASWKKFTARKICDSLRLSGEERITPVWHREYWDRFIRDRSHLTQAIEYIHHNPVKAGLAAMPQHYRWSSAYPGNAGNANLPIGASSP